MNPIVIGGSMHVSESIIIALAQMATAADRQFIIVDLSRTEPDPLSTDDLLGLAADYTRCRYQFDPPVLLDFGHALSPGSVSLIPVRNRTRTIHQQPGTYG